MKLIMLMFCFFAVLPITAQVTQIESSFDLGWKFFRGDTTGAEKVKFNDKNWRTIDIPHDWSIEDLENQETGKIIGPFSKESPGATSTGYFIGGTGWYRKTFTLPKETKDMYTMINFDGVYMDCSIWLNGKLVGNHPYGYSPFNLNLTGFLKPSGQENVIAVKVRNEGKNSRWYSGSGIYRHVSIITTKSVHIAPWGVYITTNTISQEKAEVKLSTSIQNEGAGQNKLKLFARLIGPNGKIAAVNETETSEFSGKSKEITQLISVNNPALWSLEEPNLYIAEVEIHSNGKLVDRISVPFGIRSISFDSEKGFLLNTKKVLLKGGCMHHDNGLLGSSTIDRAEERRVELMKAYGFNAIRTSHNPPSRQFLDACDRLGILVIDEAFDMWERPKNPQDYSRFFKDWWQEDIKTMIMRDRNHPSVILWSIGNEINERADSIGFIIRKQLKNEVKKLDPSRLVTEAICEFWDHKGKPWSATIPAFADLDVAGYNYQYARYKADHKQFPERIMIGTESVAKDAFDNWNQVEKNSWVIGDFVWTAMDYMGETGIGHSRLNDDVDSAFAKPWPWFNAYCGDIDLCGFKKPQLYYRDVIWKNSKLEMAVHSPIPEGKKEIISYWGWPDELQSWTWPGNEGKIMDVRVFSRCSSVRLELNGKMIDEKAVSDSTKLIATFKVPYQSGVLKATGLENGVEITSKILYTVGKPERIRLTADRSTINANRNDLSYVKIEIVDIFGNLIPNDDRFINLTVTGEGELEATGSARPNEMASFKKPLCKTFHGRALAILRPSIGNKVGTILIKAESTGILSDEITIVVK